MITAEEARRKTWLTVIGKEAMCLVEKSVNYAVAFGKFSTIIDTIGLDREVLTNIIIPELEELGYKVELIPAEPIPAGCPSERLKISWEV